MRTSPPKDLLIVSPYFPPAIGGGETQLQHLVDHLNCSSLSFKALVASLKRQSQVTNVLGFRCHYPSRSMERAYARIYEYLTEQRRYFSASYMVCQPETTCDSQGKIAKTLGEASHLSLRFPSEGEASRIAAYSPERWGDFVESATQVLSLSPKMESELLSLGFSQGQITRFLNPVDINKFRPLAKRLKRDSLPWHLPKNRRVMLSLAKPHPKKRWPDLVRAWAKACSQSHQFGQMCTLQLVFPSDICNNQLEQLKEAKWIAKGLEGSVMFHEYCPKLGADTYYNSADGFVTFSKDEGMQNTVLEALSSGLEILAPKNSCGENFYALPGSFHFFEDNNASLTAAFLKWQQASAEVSKSRTNPVRKYLAEHHSISNYSCLFPGSYSTSVHA